MKKKIILLFLFSFTAYSAGNTSSANRKKIIQKFISYAKKFNTLNITPLKAQKLIKNKNNQILFVDTREKKEMNVSMIQGAISLEKFKNNLKKYKNKTLIFYCTIGYRSGIITKKYQNLKCYNLAGGILLWAHDIGKVYHAGKQVKKIHVYSKEWNFLNSPFEAVWQ